MATTSTEDDFFDPEFLDRIRALFLSLRKRKQLKKKGVRNSPAAGFTREFKDFRHYTPRDDYRAIDWRLYARLDRLFIRLYEEIQEYHIHVVTDTSTSMAQPFNEKRTTALKLTTALAYLGLVAEHKVSVYPMNQRVENPLPPMKGQGNLQRIIDYAKGLDFTGTTNLEESFRQFQPSRQRYGIIFVISDLYGENMEEAEAAIRRAASWSGEIHMIQVCHPEEENPNLEGELQLIDAESKERRRMRLTAKDKQLYQANYQKYIKGIESACQDRQINYQPWRTDLPFEELFLEWLAKGSALSSSN